MTRFACLFSLLIGLNAYSMTLYVSPDGDDAAIGSSSEPLATIQRAVERLREADAAEHEIIVEAGAYYLASPIRLNSDDRNIRIHADGDVRLIGGRAIGGFKAVEDEAILSRLSGDARGEVMQSDLRAQGVSDFGELQLRGFGRPGNIAALELFFDGEPMTLARWPNGDWATIAGVPNGQDGGAFQYDGERPSRWQDADDVWVHGYWTRDWADSYCRIKRIDAESKTIYTEEPHGVYGYTEGKRWYAHNILEELDAPGEWFLHRDSGILYFWPPEAIRDQEIIVSTLGEALLQIDSARDIAIEGFVIECGRSDGVRMQNADSCRVAGCTIRNLGQRGVSINGGRFCQVVSCDIYETGEGGIVLSGGDRKTLTAANHSALNNDIHRYARWVRTYRPAISMNGVGNRIAHNRIHNAPHTGVLFGGNDHRLEFNEVFNLCWESGDVGAFYIGRNWTMRGHLIRHNWFYDIRGPYQHDAKSVYLDDAASGVTIEGNIFHNADDAAFIGGGHDNHVLNNLMIDCDPAVHFDARGEGWANKHIVEGGGWRMYEKLREVNYQQPPYSERYPNLVSILDERPNYPSGGIVANNVSYGGKWLRLQNVDEDDILMKDNHVNEDSNAIDWRKSDYQLPDGHPALESGYEQIPFKRIGLYLDQFRTELPGD